MLKNGFFWSEAIQFAVNADLSLERAMGIEPTLSAWEAEVLPLNYARLLIIMLYFQPRTRLDYAAEITFKNWLIPGNSRF